MNKLLALTAFTALAWAQAPAGGRGGVPATARTAAPIDLNGYWVSIVTEDWRYRMVMPSPGDYQGVPMTPAARAIADAWDPAKEEASGEPCKAFGAPSILRVPGRLHITWQDDQTLRLDTDAGKQTRLFHFGDWKAPTGPHTLQGDSTARWDLQRGTPRNGSLRVSTSNLKAGYLRKNGVPYSENATVVEYFDVVKGSDGSTLLVVTSVVTDSQYLSEPFIVSTHFRKQMDASGWSPKECTATW
jgi:hypothetical protein